MKSPQAFRTISEVSNEVNIPAHVLRFWETKFPNINPLKRSGNRRYYRPEDVKLIIRIKTLLYDNGYTVKGVQKLLKENDNKNNEKNVIKEKLSSILKDIDNIIKKL
jgi:DNA-binding transcriptional MerR regulator|tara:strand:- start:422 stop:742 length:321 start_codon:yes stop_codon:yes gene_type:complete